MSEQNPQLKHIAIIMDGNRRWAVAHGLPRLKGHTEGTETLKRIAHATADRGIEYLTVWALSTENFNNRTEKELKHLFSLIEQIPRHFKEFEERGSRMNVIGDITKLPQKTQQVLNEMVERTKHLRNHVITFAINYGGRDELIRATKQLLSDNITPDQINEKLMDSYLDTSDLPEPDLIIRTGGAQRLSGFLPWQGIYSELYFTETYWPSFKDAELDEAIEYFHGCQRNRGK